MTGLHEPVRYVDLVISALQRFPERVAFRQEARDLTYAQAADLLARWVRVFNDRGLCARDGVGVLSL